jgi:signal transduction histidine kinase
MRTGAPHSLNLDEPELSQLFRSEFGSPTEVLARFAIIIAGSITLLFYAGWWIGPIWGAAYLTSQGLAYLAMTRPQPPHGRLTVRLAYLTYMLTTGVYAALPGALLTVDDMALSFCGAMGLIALGVFTLWREEPPAPLLVFDIGLGAAAGLLALAVYVPRVDGIWPQVIMVMLCITAVGYYAMALITTRATRVRLKAAAQRGIEAQKMEAIGRLSGGVAHDFNNILTVLQGNLELYREVDDPAERDKLIADAHVAAKRAAGLVAQLLAFARRAPLAPSVIEAASVIEELTSMVARVLPASITVFPAVPTEPVHARADHDQLLSSLLNLVINARDAMGGRGEITLAARPVTITAQKAVLLLDAGRYVCFSVSDTGGGMTRDVADRALEPFFTTKPVGAGSGLGLPTAKGFAEQSGGALDIETGPVGTTVTIYLPRAPAPGP